VMSGLFIGVLLLATHTSSCLGISWAYIVWNVLPYDWIRLQKDLYYCPYRQKQVIKGLQDPFSGSNTPDNHNHVNKFVISTQDDMVITWALQYLLLSRYIHFNDKYYGSEGVLLLTPYQGCLIWGLLGGKVLDVTQISCGCGISCEILHLFVRCKTERRVDVETYY